MPLPPDLVCKCFRVSETEIRAVLAENEISEVEQVSELCKAGRGCGRCHEQIEELIAETSASA
jgi:NifU-like protein